MARGKLAWETPRPEVMLATPFVTSALPLCYSTTLAFARFSVQAVAFATAKSRTLGNQEPVRNGLSISAHTRARGHMARH